MSLLKSALVLVLFFFTILVEARALPSFLREAGSHYLVRSLGSACYTMTTIDISLPCNPAAIALDRKDALFDSSVFIGSDVEAIHLVQDAVDNGNEEALMRLAASSESILQAEAALQTTILGPTRGVTIEPYRLVYYSRTENSAMPMVDLIAAQQRSIKAQIGSFFNENFAGGLQFRYSNLRVIDTYFAASEALVEGSQELWASEELNQFFFEPGALYQWHDVAWEPQVSAAITQLGWSTPKSEAFPTSPELFLGASVKPFIPWGLLEVALQLHLSQETENWNDVPRFAVAYRFSMITAALSAGERDSAISAFFDMGNLNVGVAFKETRYNNGLFAQVGYTL
ncbi:hypothetical protein D3C87_87600 [compost metagenome]